MFRFRGLVQGARDASETREGIRGLRPRGGELASGHVGEGNTIEGTRGHGDMGTRGQGEMQRYTDK